jgi:uncharacterized protein YjbI with pentapeptide repeats
MVFTIVGIGGGAAFNIDELVFAFMIMSCVLPSVAIFWFLMQTLTVSTKPVDRNAPLLYGSAISILLILFLVLAFLLSSSIDKWRRCNAIGPNAVLVWCKYEHGDLSGVNLKKADLNHANLSGAKLADVKFDGAILDFAELNGANLVGASLIEASLIWTNLNEADLTKATLDNATLDNAKLNGANLTGASLVGASLNGTDLSETDLTKATLENANLSEADLSGADVTDATFDNANMDEANLHNATGVTDAMLNSIASWRGLSLESNQEIIEHLGAACRGQSVVGNIDYIPDESFHPLVLLNADGQQHRWTRAVPRKWWPSQVRLAELVACVHEWESLIQTCHYTHGGVEVINLEIRRYVSIVKVRLVEASTGTKITEFSLSGAEPRACPEEMGGRGASSYDIHGYGVDPEELLDGLSKYVNPAGVMERITVSRSN